MDEKLIYLARHGDIGLGREKRYIGRLDLPLSSEGKEQASFLKNMLGQAPLDNIYCSDLKRSQQTAEIVASARRIIPVVCGELHELDMGDWDGELFSTIKMKYPREYQRRGEDIANYCPVNGESFSDCFQRVIPVFENLVRSAERKILIVGHAGVNRVILCYILGMPLANVFRFEQSYGCLNLIYNIGSGYQLKYLNRTACQDAYLA